MSYEKDLSDILPDEVFNHPDCFSEVYWKWEDQVAKPELEKLGFEVGFWVTLERDGFGPLSRGVTLTKNGTKQTYFYG